MPAEGGRERISVGFTFYQTDSLEKHYHSLHTTPVRLTSLH
jgi:hypothetical protein